jgi:hypothetical protein
MPDPRNQREAWRQWLHEQPGVIVHRRASARPWFPPVDVTIAIDDINELTGDDWDESESDRS